MFELSVACKYLIPRWRQLSVSIISLVSILVIALVVWLIVVFFSVKEGLEKSWVDKLIALTAPIRVTPTEQYYHSYYYLSDSISSHSGYTLKTIGEKLQADQTDPYNPEMDEEPPHNWLLPDRSADGSIKDLAKLAYLSASNLRPVKGLKINDYEMTFANLRLKLLRPNSKDVLTNQATKTQQFIEQASYLGSFDPDTPEIAKTLVPLTAEDAANLIAAQAINSGDNAKELKQQKMQARLERLFEHLQVSALKTPSDGWRLPTALLPKNALLKGIAIQKNGIITQLIVPESANTVQHLFQQLRTEGKDLILAEIDFGDAIKLKIDHENERIIPPGTPIKLAPGLILEADLVKDSLASAKKTADMRFKIKGNIQGISVQGEVPLGHLEIAGITNLSSNSQAPFAHLKSDRSGIVLADSPEMGDAILIPRSFKDSGALIGDQGFLSYHSPTPSAVQEQRIPVYVAGFYDPGIMPMGGKFVLASHKLTAMIRASHSHEEALLSNGFNIRFDDIANAPKIKASLVDALKKAEIDSYWKVETYQEYEFTKDLIQQLHSEKNLFSLISMVIIIVACSNIISMLIILVNDKKIEIGILRSMGATSGSIAAIFGICGVVMGAIGSIIGIIAAVITLHNLEYLVGFISRVQGYDLFNPVFYGNILPNQISFEVLGAVVMATAFISLLAGIVPAVKASLLRPSAILRSE